MSHAPMAGVYPASEFAWVKTLKVYNPDSFESMNHRYAPGRTCDIKVDGEGLGSVISVHGVSNHHAQPSRVSSDKHSSKCKGLVAQI